MFFCNYHVMLTNNIKYHVDSKSERYLIIWSKWS